MKKIVVLSAFVLIVLSCAEKKDKASGVDAKKIYKQNCVICHGLDGKLGLNNSKDLTKSALTLQERMMIVKNGKAAMTPFGNILSDKEIQAVSEYTFKLK
jgi:mono/diheme cytochrome c family protein